MGSGSHADESFRDGAEDRRPLRQAPTADPDRQPAGGRSEHRAREAIPMGGSLVRSAHRARRGDRKGPGAQDRCRSLPRHGGLEWANGVGRRQGGGGGYPHRHEHPHPASDPSHGRSRGRRARGRRGVGDPRLRGLRRTHRSRHRLCQEHHPRGPAPGGGCSRGRERLGREQRRRDGVEALPAERSRCRHHPGWRQPPRPARRRRPGVGERPPAARAR